MNVQGPLYTISSIKGLSERRRLPRLGKIRLGIKKTAPGKGEYPAEVDYFVCPDEVKRKYGDKPKSLRIRLPLEDLSQVFPQAYKWYGAGSGLKCKGDGQIAHRRWADVEPGLQASLKGTHDANDLVEIPCPCPRLKSGECNPRGHLMVYLPDVSPSGIYEIMTGSAHNIIELNSAIDFLRAVLGRIAMVPLILRREPVEITYQGKRRTHYLLKLSFDGDLAAVQHLRESVTTSPLMPLVLPTPADEGPAMNEGTHDAIEAAVQDVTPKTNVTVEPPPPAVPVTPEHPQPIAYLGPSTLPGAEPPTTPAPPALALTPQTRDQTVAPPPDTRETPPPKPRTHLGDSTATGPQCGCGIKVTQAVADYSLKHFGEIMCMGCQKRRYGVARRQSA